MHLLARTDNMTRKLQNPTAEDGRSRKRVLKPVVEKKRRDRINQSLAELRSLLLSQTSDARLQNPKVEKAEILDMAVEYLQKWTDEKKRMNDHAENLAPVLNLHLPEAPLLTMESAGFHQCVAQLTSYMQKITPSQRVSLIEGLKHHTERQQTNSATAPISQRTTGAEAAPRLTSVDSSERREGAPNFFLFPSLSPPQPLCSTPCHEHTSPPPSPWLSPCFSTYATSPSFPSFGPHFSSPNSLSSLSSNTSFFTFPPVAHHTGTPAFRYPPHPAPGEGSPPNSSLMWRPWC